MGGVEGKIMRCSKFIEHCSIKDFNTGMNIFFFKLMQEMLETQNRSGSICGREAESMY